MKPSLLKPGQRVCCLHPSPEPKWYLAQRKRWAKLERAGWQFEAPQDPNPERVTMLIKKAGLVRGEVSILKARFTFRGMHTAMLRQCETMIAKLATTRSNRPRPIRQILAGDRQCELGLFKTVIKSGGKSRSPWKIAREEVEARLSRGRD